MRGCGTAREAIASRGRVVSAAPQPRCPHPRYGTTATPHGRVPTFTVRSTFIVADVDDGDVVGEAVRRVRRPAVGRERDAPRAAPHRNARRARAAWRRRAGRGRGRRRARRRDAAPSGETATPTGFSSPVADPHAREHAMPPRVDARDRCRPPRSSRRRTGRRARTRRRAAAHRRGRSSTTFSVRMSITEIVLLVSPVTYTQRPSGETVTPSGSVPTTSEASTLPDRRIDDRRIARVLVRRDDAPPIRRDRELLGVGAGRQCAARRVASPDPPRRSRRWGPGSAAGRRSARRARTGDRGRRARRARGPAPGSIATGSSVAPSSSVRSCERSLETTIQPRRVERRRRARRLRAATAPALDRSSASEVPARARRRRALHAR